MEVIRRVFRRRTATEFEPPTWPEAETEPAPPRLVSRYLGAAGRRLRRATALAPFSRLTVGLTYEGAALKLLVTEGRRIVSWERIPFDPRLVNGTVIAEPYNLGRLLRDALARRGLPANRLHCALPAAGSLSRVVEVPRVGVRSRRQTVVGEAIRALGVTPGRHYVYWQTVDDSPDAQLVFVLAVPRDAMRSLIETMRAAEIRPRTVDVTPLALARAVGQPDEIVVELDPSGVDLVVVLDDVPLAMRSIVWGEQALTLEEAQEAALDLLVNELRGYEDVYVGSRIERNVPIYLAGDMGTGLRLSDRIRTTTGHPIGRLAPLVDYPEEFPIAEYLANVGLVLKEE